MHLVLDARCLRLPLHGIARYTLNLLRQLPLTRADHLHILYDPRHWHPEPQARTDWVAFSGHPLDPHASLKLKRLLRQTGAALFHSPSFLLPWGLPIPTVLTLHDLIHVERPQDYSRLHALYFSLLRRRLKPLRGLLTVSEASARIIRAWAGPDCPPLTVTPLGLEAHFQPLPEDPDWRQRHGLPPRYWLFVGNAKAHKNLALLRTVWAQHPELPPLVALGVPGEPPPLIALTNFPEAELPALYSHALGLISPSLCEGFGLPPLEARACGCPVLVSDLPVFHEVLGEGARYFDPHSPDSLRALLNTSVPPSPVPERARFDWARLATDTYHFYQNCLDGR
jgi:glycosyltransferase involved in cell wall biosynthesis